MSAGAILTWRKVALSCHATLYVKVVTKSSFFPRHSQLIQDVEQSVIFRRLGWLSVKKGKIGTTGLHLTYVILA